MKMNIIEQTNRKLVFEMEDVDNTFCNILKKQLQSDKNVSVATYAIRHPLVGTPKFIIETTAQSTPKKALEKAVDDLTATNKDFLAKFKRQIKQ